MPGYPGLYYIQEKAFRQDFHTKYLAATMAVALIIGPFFTGHLRPGDSMAGRAKMLSNMRYHTSVIISLFVSLGVLADSSRRLMKLSAYAQRIQQLQSISRSIASGAPYTLCTSTSTPCVAYLAAMLHSTCD